MKIKLYRSSTVGIDLGDYKILTDNFNILYKAQSLKDYKKLLLNAKKLKIKHTKNDLG